MSNEPERPIAAVYGHEPLREGEYPTAAIVGKAWRSDPDQAVERIAYREQNFGDHGLGWYDVWVGGAVMFSISARAVAEIHYGPAA